MPALLEDKNSNIFVCLQVLDKKGPPSSVAFEPSESRIDSDSQAADLRSSQVLFYSVERAGSSAARPPSVPHVKSRSQAQSRSRPSSEAIQR